MPARRSLNAQVASGQDPAHKAGSRTRGDVLREHRSDELRLLRRARLAKAAWRLDPFAIELDALPPTINRQWCERRSNSTYRPTDSRSCGRPRRAGAN
jgi:hypothetical protein